MGNLLIALAVLAVLACAGAALAILALVADGLAWSALRMGRDLPRLSWGFFVWPMFGWALASWASPFPWRLLPAALALEHGAMIVVRLFRVRPEWEKEDPGR